MKTNRLAIFLLPLFFACHDSKWESKTANKFLSSKKIDTSAYHTFEEWAQKGEIKKIRTTEYDRFEKFYLLRYPFVSNRRFVYIEQDNNIDDQKNIIVKYNDEGDPIDSLIIDNESTIINSYIIKNDTYQSWLIDDDKSIKKLENVNYFSESDTTKIKSIVNSLNKNNVSYYATSDYASDKRIDTCNYIISFDKKLIKYNFLRKINPEYDLKFEKDNTSEFSKDCKTITSIQSEDLFKVDNFFAKVYYTYIPGNKIEFKLYPNGGGTPQCNNFDGSAYFSLQTTSKLKLKMDNQSICENRNLKELSEYHTIYTSDFLNFYLIEKDSWHAVFYVVKK
jgi:hypothetical protein